MHIVLKDNNTQQNFTFNDQNIISSFARKNLEFCPVFIGFVIYDQLKKQFIDDINLVESKVFYTSDKSQSLLFHNFKLIKQVNQLIRSKITVFAFFDLKEQPFLHLQELFNFNGAFSIDFPYIQGTDQPKILQLIHTTQFQQLGLNHILAYFEKHQIPLSFTNLFGVLSAYHGSALNAFANFLYDSAKTTEELQQLQQLNVFRSPKMQNLLQQSIENKSKKQRFFKIENDQFFYDGKIQVLKDALQNIQNCYYRCQISNVKEYLPEHRYLFHVLFRFQEDYLIKLKLSQCFNIEKLSNEFNQNIFKVYASDDILKFKSFCKKIIDMLEKTLQFYENAYKASIKKSEFSSNLKKINTLNTNLNQQTKKRLVEISVEIKRLSSSHKNIHELQNKINDTESKLKKYAISLEKDTINKDEYDTKTAKLQKKIGFIQAEIKQKQQLSSENILQIEKLETEHEELRHYFEESGIEAEYTNHDVNFSCLDIDFNNKNIDETDHLLKSFMLNIAQS